MKHVVVGTAGHIDHGKTQLVKALTGVNTDRFKEEQERGITIDIGFAPLPLGPDLTIGFVDVPGHERFVKNMLAGVWGIDLVLMVIAADESIKPQTREHFDICTLLQVGLGLVALTKIDLVDAELAELAALEVRDFVRGSFLEEAPILPVSARTGEGLEDLKSALARAAARVEPGRSSRLLRLPVDRSFSMKGFGTVVTGTLVSGEIREGDTLRIYPGAATARVRGLQVHGAPVARARAGQRTAINLQGIEAAAVRRGDVLARPGEIRSSSLLDVRLRLLPGAPAALRDMARVRFHHGTSEHLARVKLMGVQEIAPGDEAFAQVRLESEGCCLPGDRFVVRRYSPTVTIGGGVVLDAAPRKHRGRSAAGPAARLARLGSVDALERARVYLEAERFGLAAVGLAVRLGVAADEAEKAANDLVKGGEAVRSGAGAGAVVLSAAAARDLESAVARTLREYHQANPLRAGMPLEELRERALGGASAEVQRLVLDRMASAGSIRARKEFASLADHEVVLAPEDVQVMQGVEEAFRRQGLNPPTLEDLSRDQRLDAGRAEKVAHLLLASGRLVRIRDGRMFHVEAIEGLKYRLWGLLPSRRIIDIGAFKELTGTSRRNAIPLLEHLDAVKVTRRMGSDREILPPPGG